jgi:hypothetical protein
MDENGPKRLGLEFVNKVFVPPILEDGLPRLGRDFGGDQGASSFLCVQCRLVQRCIMHVAVVCTLAAVFRDRL